jgi:predicted RNase H-like HicB family nuclease
MAARGLFHWLRRSPPEFHVRLYWSAAHSNGVEWWLAAFEELPGCMVQGNSLGEAESTLWAILPGYLRQLRAHGLPVPPTIDAPLPTIEGVSVVMSPAGIAPRPGDPGVTGPSGRAVGELGSIATRADVVLRGS